MLELFDGVVDCGMKYTEEERKDFFDALLLYAYFKKQPPNLDKSKWKGDFNFFAPLLKPCPSLIDDLDEPDFV